MKMAATANVLLMIRETQKMKMKHLEEDLMCLNLRFCCR